MNFRRWITALAVLALFAGFASAQVLSSTAGTGPFQCTASVAVPPVVRAEGLTELVGDIVLTCTGGPTPGVNNSYGPGGSAIPTANVTVSFGTNVTSRLLNYNILSTPSTITSPNTSEALLLIDEPGSGLQIAPPTVGGTPPTGVGPGAAQTLCTNGGFPASYQGAGPGGCPQYTQLLGGDYVMSSSPTSLTAPANVYAGVVSSNQVTFFGIPILPPTSTGISRVFRMTNIRINANALNAGGFTGTFQVLASISISGSTSVPINTPVQIAGFVQTGLTTAVRNAGNTGAIGTLNFNQCQKASAVTNVGLLEYSENFGTAFKTRVAPQNASAGSGQYPTLPGQNVPGAIYNSESGFIFTQLTGYNSTLSGGITAGLADYGTRLKAVFNNIPTGVSIYVSTTNIVNLTGATYPPGGLAGNSTTSFAQLVTTETAPEGSFVPATGYTTVTPTSIAPFNSYAMLAPVNGSATAVWEIVNTNPATNENFFFGVWTSYASNAGANQPPLGTVTVNMSYAPNATQGAFTATAGAAASSTLTLPRFADTSVANNLFTIVQCTTSLLFPFITNQAGFDTGIALMNTSMDPFGTAPQAGTCTMYFYGQNAPPNYTTASIPSGMNVAASTYAFLASSIAPSFQGYMIATCNFQYAHGYAFITDLGAQKLAEGYLALIFTPGPNPAATCSSSSGCRNTTTPEALEN